MSGRNGGGDRYFTGGEITIGVIRPDAVAKGGSPDALPSPTHVELKKTVWSTVKNVLARAGS